MGSEPEAENQRTYSDVVASRPASPARKSGDSVVLPIGRRNTRADRGANELVQGNQVVIKKLINKPISASESSSEYEAENRNEWTTVQRRRARSAEPTPTRRNRVETSKLRIPKPVVLEKEFSKVVHEAEKSLTPAERETIARRSQKVAKRRERSKSRGEGPSEPKGKSIDPREWGNAGLSPEEINVETQRAALESYAKPKKGHKERRTSGRPSKHKKVGPAEMRPETQIDPKSYLGVTLKNVDKGSNRKRRDPSPSSSDSSSEGSSSESSSPESESSTSDSSDRSDPGPRKC